MAARRGVLFLPEVANHGHVEPGAHRTLAPGQQFCRLENGEQLAVERFRDIISDAVMQPDQRIGFGHAVTDLPRVGLLEVVYISARECHNQRGSGVSFAETPDGIRASPGVQRNHQVRGFTCIFRYNAGPVPQISQMSRPALRRCRLPDRDPRAAGVTRVICTRIPPVVIASFD